MTAADPCWQVVVDAPIAVAAAVADVLAPFVDAVSVFPDPAETDPGVTSSRVTAFAEQEPDRAALNAAIASLVPGLEPTLTDLGARDWLAENRASFSPIAVGRFYVYPTHHATPPPAGACALAINAAAAFGTGAHGSTQGCLAALDGLAKAGDLRRRWPILDVGCGTAVLALAAASLARRVIVAGDIDPAAVAIAADNARLNGLAPWLIAVTATGLDHPAIATRAPYGLIFANILARPLADLAPAIAGHLRPGGHVILSGLLATQERQVLAAYLNQRLSLRRRIDVGEWRTLVLQAPTP